jgi:hypothetical protein
MTANAINAKSEALELHELSSEELDAVSGGSVSVAGNFSPVPQNYQSKSVEAAKAFGEAIQH